MEEALIEIVNNGDGIYVYFGVILLLLLGAIGFPVPEDIPIILGGILSAKGMAKIQNMFFACYVSVVLADLFIFMIGYLFGQKLLKFGENSRFFPAITADRVENIRDGLRKRRLMYIFIARHLFAVRTITFLISGALRIPVLEFFIADALAALVSVSVMLSLGYFLGETLSPEVLNHIVSKASLYMLAAVLIAGLLYYRKKKRKWARQALQKENTPDSPSSPPLGQMEQNQK